MKPEKQRIAIAEAFGLPKPYSMWSGKDRNTPCHSVMVKNGWKRGIPIPDYLNDLNAMHEAEKVMGYDDRLNYPAQLFDVVCRTSGEWQKVFNKIHPDAWALQATADQRAEAFLRAIGKWEEEA
jgi:hypothetical protein